MNAVPISDENMLGPYRLLRRLGEGGMGIVYLAEDSTLGRQVAIKVLRKHDGEGHREAARVRRFLREARSAARLNHPHVVTIHAVGEQAGAPYLVMEYVAGGSLSELLRREGPLPWRAAAGALRDACLGLAAAHAAGIVHRDVKPANLMRAPDGRVKLVDFGLARLGADTDGELTFPGAFMGSPSYASPEQIANGAARIDGRSDLYSLAATAHALLTGAPPFIDDDQADVLRRHLDEPFPDLRGAAPETRRAEIPERLIQILRRASCKLPAERFASAGEMARELEACLSAQPGPESPSAVMVTGAAPTSAAPRQPASDAPRHTRIPSRLDESITQCEDALSQARTRSDSLTQLHALRRLFGLYRQLGRSADATRAFREALVIHVKLANPIEKNAAPRFAASTTADTAGVEVGAGRERARGR